MGYANAVFSSAESPRAVNRAFGRLLFFTILLLGQALMASTLDFVEVKGVKVPVIFEEDKRLPIVSM
ncbi:MAG: insulinase family protein, partial [Sulfuricurvum sp.]|nr:insulinase family protein [Sulfuricurvum sp.]